MLIGMKWAVNSGCDSNGSGIRRGLLAGLVLALLVAPAGADDALLTDDAAPPELDPVEQFFADAGDALFGGKIDFNLRLRIENVHDDIVGGMGRLGAGNALTSRLRLGYTSAEWNGLSFHADMETIVAADDHTYNDLRNGRVWRPVIADPEGTELNQLYGKFRWEGFTFIGGRQRIILDDARFVGNVGWRQDEQTFDAGTVKYEGLEDFVFYYGYLDRINRIFEETADFQSDTHIANVSYDGLDIGKITAFAYWVDLEGDSNPNDGNTYGIRFQGSTKLDDEGEHTLGYIGSYARQEDAGVMEAFDADYYLAELSLKKKSWNTTFGAGYEVLGTDSGLYGFRTPLATGHKFNGWADRFLVTPNGGLQDVYFYAGTTLPWDIKAKAVYHLFYGEESAKAGAAHGSQIGSELDLVASKKLTDHVSVLSKFAYYFNDDAGMGGFGSDVIKFWFQVEITY